VRFLLETVRFEIATSPTPIPGKLAGGNLVPGKSRFDTPTTGRQHAAITLLMDPSRREVSRSARPRSGDVCTTQRILNGTEDLSVWSEEELIRGVRRGKDGRFRNKPKVIPHAVHAELVKRKMAKAYDLLRESTYDAVQVLVEVAKDENADTATRVKAAELILDRTLGKAPQHVSLDFQAGLAVGRSYGPGRRRQRGRAGRG
jgi:hypothetical protein